MSVMNRGAACATDVDLEWEKEPKHGWTTRTREKLAAGRDRSVEMVQRHPYTTIALAAGIGFVAGLILKRR